MSIVGVFIENLLRNLECFYIVRLREVLFCFDLSQTKCLPLAQNVKNAEFLHHVFARFARYQRVV